MPTRHMNAILPAASVPLRRKRGIAAVRGGLRRPGAAYRAARAPQHATILRFGRRQTTRAGLFALIQFRTTQPVPGPPGLHTDRTSS
ncbi:hypothetical protein F01_421089 [Burkholderia cenocepacia]|nr:hypothetical protein F01_421089 [Burkholderia cenocepacia]